MSDLPFSIQKAFGKGTATPCVARTLLQAGDLLNAFTRDERLKQDVLQISYEVMEHQLACLEVVEIVVPQITAGINRLNAGLGMETKGLAISLPSVPNIKKLVERFLHSAKLSLRDTGGLFDAFYGKTFQHHFHKAREWAEAEFSAESDLVRVLAGNAQWLERLIRWRNAVEHPTHRRGRLHVNDFRLFDVDQDHHALVRPPVLYQGTENPLPVREYLSITQDNLLTLFEDVLSSLLLLLPNPLGIAIREIPEHERRAEKPLRLVPDLADRR